MAAGRKHVRVALHFLGGKGLALRGGSLSREHHITGRLSTVGSGGQIAHSQPAVQGDVFFFNDVFLLFALNLAAANAIHLGLIRNLGMAKMRRS